MVLVLDVVRIMQVHPKGIAHPTKAFLDVIWKFSRLIRRTQAQTHSKWAECCCLSSLVMVGCTALAAALKRTAILVPVMKARESFLL